MPDFDVIIIGGGPGGISSLLWCNSLGLRAILLERTNEIGGQMLMMYHRIINYPGLTSQNGCELRDHFITQLNDLQLDYRVNCAIEHFDLDAMRIRLAGESITGRAIIFATGARKKRLGIPGETEFEGRGVSFSATRDHQDFAGCEVIVIGGGDSAFENCLILARVCPRVTLIHRSDNFRARSEWIHAVREHPRISIITHAQAKAILGRDEVTHLIIEDTHTGTQQTLPTQGVFIRIGISPNTDFLREKLTLDEEGYITADNHQRTSRPMIYAVGDVCRPICLSVATAVGHGAIATKDISRQLINRSFWRRS